VPTEISVQQQGHPSSHKIRNYFVSLDSLDAPWEGNKCTDFSFELTSDASRVLKNVLLALSSSGFGGD
jgi:hypothetical protein